jgi:hypothetical protein
MSGAVSPSSDLLAMAASTTAPCVPVGHELDAEIEDERAGRDERLELSHSLDPVEIPRRRCYRDPDRSVVDLVAHLGMWLAEAGIRRTRGHHHRCPQCHRQDDEQWGLGLERPTDRRRPAAS